MKGLVEEVEIRLLLPDPAEMVSCEGGVNRAGFLSVMETMRLQLQCDQDLSHTQM